MASGAKLRKLLVQGGGQAVDAGVQQRLELPQLGGEAVAGMDARDTCRVGAAERSAQSGMLSPTRATVRVQVGRV